MASTRSHTREAAREDGQRAQPRASTRSLARLRAEFYGSGPVAKFYGRSPEDEC
jgi:hypothetical protein